MPSLNGSATAARPPSSTTASTCIHCSNAQTSICAAGENKPVLAVSQEPSAQYYNLDDLLPLPGGAV